MKYWFYNFTLVVITCLCCFSLQANTAEKPSQQTQLQDEEASYHWEVDIGAMAYYSHRLIPGLTEDNEDLTLALILSGGFYYGNFFIESTPLASRTSTFGYVLREDEDEQINLIAESWFHDVENDFSNSKRKNRYSSTEVGIEYRRSYKKHDLRVRALHDALSNHNGFVAAVEIAKPIFTRSTLIVPSFELAYLSQETVNYYYGVKKTVQEPYARSLDYSATGDGYIASARVYFDRPITKSMSIVGTLTYGYLSKTISDSPIVRPRQDIYNAGIGVLWSF